jgi:predicted nuclease with RNAse H fold
MVSRAIGLKAEFKSRGLAVIEVYPYATKRRLWGIFIPKKTTSRGREFLKARLSGTIANISEYEVLGHDQYDAIIAAYTAYLHQEGLTELMGDPVEGQIAVPCGSPRSHI